MNNKIRITILLTFITVATLLHNVSSMEDPLFLNVYQRLYYIPIVMAAYWFGIAGALVTSIISTFLYPHHGHFHWPDDPFYKMNQYAEMIMFNLIAVVTGILSDLETRQRRKYEKTAEELNIAYQKLQDSFDKMRKVDRLSALGELSAAMAHEIRNPLGSIKGGIEIIESESGSKENKEEFIAIIKKEIARLDKIISDFLKYARPMSPEMRKHDINSVIRSVVSLVQKKAEQHHIKIEKDLYPGLPEIDVDSEQIKQVLLNIILNAIQSITGKGNISIRSKPSGNDITIIIKDSGGGISKENQARLFDPFFTTKVEGTGLGLSISFQIIKAHKGDIEVNAEEGKGSEFLIKLPTIEDKDEE